MKDKRTYSLQELMGTAKLLVPVVWGSLVLKADDLFSKVKWK